MLDRLKAHLIDEWKSAWKLWSVQLNAAGVLLLSGATMLKETMEYVPPAFVGALPYAKGIALGLFVLGLVARILRQKPKAP